MTSVAATRRRKKANAEAWRAATRTSTEKLIKRAIRSLAYEDSPAKHSALYRLHAEGAITAPQYDAACRLRDDELDSRDSGVADYLRETRGNGGYPAERLARQAKALGRYGDAQQALMLAGLAIMSVTLNVCIGDFEPRELGRRAAEGDPEQTNAKTKLVVTALRRGLDALAKHYGGR